MRINKEFQYLSNHIQMHTVCIEPYQSTSKPLLAATLAGMCSVCNGSTIAKVGLSDRLAMPVNKMHERKSHI